MHMDMVKDRAFATVLQYTYTLSNTPAFLLCNEIQKMVWDEGIKIVKIRKPELLSVPKL